MYRELKGVNCSIRKFLESIIMTFHNYVDYIVLTCGTTIGIAKVHADGLFLERLKATYAPSGLGGRSIPVDRLAG